MPAMDPASHICYSEIGTGERTPGLSGVETQSPGLQSPATASEALTSVTIQYLKQCLKLR